jgi:hypothetical protein
MKFRSKRSLGAALWGAAVLLAGVAAGRWREASAASAEASVNLIPPATVAAPKIGKDSLARIARFTADHNPFRLNHQPGASGPSTNEAASVGIAKPAAPKPALVLKGMVGAAPAWQAVLEGVPGRQGSVVVAQGDTIGGLRVRRVSRDTVVVQGADTNWKLTLERPGS